MAGKSDPLAIAVAAVQAALKAGAGEADAYVRTASTLDIEVHEGAVENLKRATTSGLGLRVTRENRTALVHSTDLSLDSLAALAARAVEMTRQLPASGDPVLRAEARKIEALPHSDPGLAGEPFAKKKARLVEIEKATLSVPEVARAVSVSWAEVDGEAALANSKGLGLREPMCNVTLGCESLAERDGESSTGVRYVSVPARSALPEPAVFGREAGERAVALLGAKPIASARVPVIFTPETGWTVLVCLTPALNGENVVQQRSYLADQMGQMLVSRSVTIRDNPLLASAPGARTFDAEGVATRNVALIEHGRLNAFLTDLAVAQKLGTESNGNATRGDYDGPIGIGTSNYYMEPGDATQEEIVGQTERGLLLMTLSGWWVGMSPATDTFSAAAMGLWIEGGKVVHPVRGITIGGTLREMLAGIDRVGNDLTFTGTVRTPTFRVGGMVVGGV